MPASEGITTRAFRALFIRLTCDILISKREGGSGATLKQKEIWLLSADGKTLTVNAHVTLPNGEFDVKQVFEKQ